MLRLALTLLATPALVHAAVISSPSPQNTVIVKFGVCSNGFPFQAGFTNPSRSDSFPGNDYPGAILARHSFNVDCTLDGGRSVIGTNGVVAIGTVATLERDAPTLDSVYAGAQAIDFLKRGTRVRILHLTGPDGFRSGEMKAIVEVLDANGNEQARAAGGGAVLN